jgi:hypothetical protein
MKQRNRGKAPNDHLLFNEKFQAVFYEALEDMSYLLSREYGVKSSLQIVGSKYRLNARQQKALLGMSASNASVISRKNKELSIDDLAGKEVIIDGFNLLIILESAISGAFVFKGMDGAYRDVMSVHGGYKRVLQTEEAILLIGKMLQELQVKKAVWYLDAPISNSGRLKTHLRETAEREGFPWEIYLANNPDKELIASDKIMISSDAWILEDGQQWFNAMDYLIQHHLENVELFHATPAQKIAIVTCVKEKQIYPCSAKEMYKGELFESFLQAAKNVQADEIFILSGKYGLLDLNDKIEPYDVNLNLQSETYQTKWAKKVLTQLRKKTDLNRDDFHFFTSENYCKNIISHIRQYTIPLEIL